MGLKHFHAAVGIIQLIVRIFLSFDLILDKPLWCVELANIVIQGTGSDQVYIGTDGSGPFLCKPTDHQCVLESPWSFCGETA